MRRALQVIDEAPGQFGELTHYFAGLETEELRRCWVACCVDAVICNDFSPGDVARCLMHIAERLGGSVFPERIESLRPAAAPPTRQAKRRLRSGRTPVSRVRPSNQEPGIGARVLAFVRGRPDGATTDDLVEGLVISKSSASGWLSIWKGRGELVFDGKRGRQTVYRAVSE